MGDMERGKIKEALDLMRAQKLRVFCLSTSRADVAMLEPVAQMLGCALFTPWHDYYVHLRQPDYYESAPTRAQQCFLNLPELRKGDLLILAGDRHETLCCAVWAKQYGVTIAHIGGGDARHDFISIMPPSHPDHLYRDALSMLADYHYVANETAKLHLIDIQRDRICVSGLPSLDKVYTYTRVHAVPVRQSGLAVFTLHSDPTQKDGGQEMQTDVLSWMHDQQVVKGRIKKVLFSYPGDDRGGSALANILRVNIERGVLSDWEEIGKEHGSFYDAMQRCEFAIGNSSAFRIEGGLLGTPCIELGLRQMGRQVPPNVFACTGSNWKKLAEKWLAVIAKKELPDMHHNWWGHPTGHAADEIVRHLCVALTSSPEQMDSLEATS